ncbi:MAG: MBOAT family protein [Erysipelotrichales bacterium]|nr:MAG: MBOAT family protein [Erysipelotrichales bacterium]
MVFSSPVFVFLFLPIVYLFNLALPKKFSNLFLLALSLLFYAWVEPLYVFLMILSGFVNYSLAIGMDQNRKLKKSFLLAMIVFNIGILGLFKYGDFIILSINGFLGSDLHLLNLPLPIVISFYTFQTMSYMFDVYRDETPVQRNFFSLLLYITFFPQLIAGPIVKYHDIALEIKQRRVSLNGTALGLRRFIFGLSKKLLLANSMAVIADKLYALPNSDISTTIAWMAAIAYLFQIYFDFSGYSDMAIGMGEMFGFHFKENFNYPYISSSVQEFWRRWHMSLSSWFKLYVYIPLGGNRKGKGRALFNRILIFFLTGLWHGASWTFVLWGLYHGMFLLLEQTLLNVEKWPRPFRHFYTLLIVVIGFVIFRADNFTQALVFIRSMFSINTATAAGSAQLMILMTPSVFLLFGISIVASTPIKKFIQAKDPTVISNRLSYVLAFVLWFACLLSLSATTYNPFIYFRF